MIKVEPTAESLELQIGVTARGNRVAESLAAVKDEVNSSWAAAQVLSEVVEESAMAAILQGRYARFFNISLRNSFEAFERWTRWTS